MPTRKSLLSISVTVTLQMTSVKVHRVFPSSCIVLHLHSKFNFIEIVLETVGQSLHHSCRTELTRQGILLPQDHQGYGRRLLEFNMSSVNRAQFTLQHWAGVRFYTASFDLAKSYVFIKQSLPPLFLLFYQPSFSRSYGVILPSSFNTIHSFVLVYSTRLLVLELVRSICLFFPVQHSSTKAHKEHSLVQLR